jgi:two-component system cell cycle sensor histidine kinase/response regulator CckA
MPGRILLVEDDARSRRNIARFLQSSGYEVYEAENGEEAVDLIRDVDHFAIVISDLRMPGMVNGIDVISYQEQVSPATGAILITGFGSKQIKGQVDSMGVVYMEKPIVLNDLLFTIEGMI